MRTVFDELEELLGKDEIAKIKANSGLTRRLEKGDEMFSVYEEESETQDPPARRTESRTDDDPPARRTEAGDQTLSDLTKALQGITAKLNDVPTKAELDAAIEKRGNELVNSVSSRVLRQADELYNIRARHNADFGEDFDSAAFDTYTTEAMKAGKRFDSITDAYEKMTAEKREDARVESKVRERLKERAKEGQGNLLPGVTPPSSKSPISTFMKRGRESDSGGNTAVDRAGSALDSALAAKSSEA